jgi:hypothetical protein
MGERATGLDATYVFVLLEMIVGWEDGFLMRLWKKLINLRLLV